MQTYPVNKKIDTYEVELPEFWNKIYDGDSVPAWGEAPANALEKFCLYIPTGAKILDIGCGAGRNTTALAKQGYTVTGVDLSQSAIDIAKAKESEATFFCLDALNDKLPGNNYDAVFDFGLYHFIPTEHREKYLQRIYDVLVTEGLYCSQSGRAVDKELSTEEYKPPQLQKEEIENTIFDTAYLQPDLLPSFKEWGDYPCWNYIGKKV